MSRCRVARALPIPAVYREVRDKMKRRGVDEALRRSVEKGEYIVDSRAVARAILRSGVLVAAQAGDGAAGAEKDQSATG